MNLKELINYILFEEEGIAELAGQCGLNKEKLLKFLEEKKQELRNQANLKNFRAQYESYEKFKNRAFSMYNKALQQGYKINNSKASFEKDIEPILNNFYNNL